MESGMVMANRPVGCLQLHVRDHRVKSDHDNICVSRIVTQVKVKTIMKLNDVNS